MALTMPAHRIQSIHGVGGMFGPSWSSLAGTSHTHESTTFNAVPNTTRGRVNLSVLAARTAAGASPQPSSHSAPSTPIVTRPRRASVRSVAVPVRRAPPPPPSRAAPIIPIDDPFADTHAPQDFIAQALPPPRAASRATQVRAQHGASSTHTRQPSAYAYSAAAPLRAQRDDQRTAKLVASVLLSRASGRPMRRRLPQSPDEKTYTKSCLSRIVQLDC